MILTGGERSLKSTYVMKKLLLFLLVILIIGCKERSQEPNYYKNLYTGEILNKPQFEEFIVSLHLKHRDSIQEPYINFFYFKLERSADSIIRKFKYDVRVGTRYVVRSREYQKVGEKVLKQVFKTIGGERISIGGKQEKPTLINLWFVNCPPCIEEMPALNRLKEKYEDKVNFIALTFEKEKVVLDFLKKKEFEFNHVANAEDFINEISSYPYPENIFINKKGEITNVEGGIPENEAKSIDESIAYFELILEKLLKEES